MPREYWMILGVGFLASFLSTPWFRRLALWLDITDRPSARKVHKRPTPYLGGLAFHAAFTAALVYIYAFAPHVADAQDAGNRLAVLYAAAFAFLLLGILDDATPIPASLKLLVQFILALFMTGMGLTITQVTSPFGGVIPLGWVGSALSVLWILTIVNAVNFIDGLDGLAAGVVFFAALANLLISFDPWQNPVCVAALTLMGATLGFLPYNFSPAKIFMGDAGSLYLGSLIAGSALASNTKGATAMSLALPLVILSLPLIDTCLAVIRRGTRGKHFFSADREHIHHRILELGFTDRQAVLAVYGLCFFLSMSSALAAQLSDRYVIPFLFVYLGWVVWALLVFKALENRIAGRARAASGPEASGDPRTPPPPAE